MNQLRHAASPYLRQHADNPVHWRQWTPETLAEAKRLNKPILLSIGYAACHWCHVMAHESFEDEATAEVMNSLFVNIKVDREERPDVDHIYMSALHTLGQRGGWPLTMFLTPEAEPFWGGTYFPKEARYGQPAFVNVLRSVERTFREKPDDVLNNTKAILARLDRAATRSDVPTVTPEEMDGLALKLCDYMDAEDGGLQGAPKFPNPQVLEFLWRGAGRTGEARPRDLVLKSLERMSQGGIYDHLGGGYARYSVDERWLVPHFEKMLYDNAQLLDLLALAATAADTPEPLKQLFAERARETVGWLAREMTDDSGAFCASLDADSDGVEGKFYVWTHEEILQVLGPDDGAFFARFYDVHRIGNWQEPHGGPTVTILNRLDTPTPKPDEATRLADLREHLLRHRAGRVRPGLDDKLLADWNGLMISALVHAGRVLGHGEWISLAARAYDAILDTMTTREGGQLRLAHSRRGDSFVRPAFALDYAAMARAALALAEAKGASATRDYVGEAAALMDALLALHEDGGLLAMSASDAGDVILRLKPTQDDAIPNAHPVALEALIRLAHLAGEQRWLDAADALFSALAPAIQGNFVGHVGTLNALDLRLRGRTVVLAGPEREPLRQAALASSWLATSVIDLADASRLPEGHPARAQAEGAGQAAAFVCQGATCSLPIHDLAALRHALAG